MKTSILCACGAVLASLAGAQDVEAQGYGNNNKLVTSKELQSLMKIDNLMKGSKTLQDFAYAYPQRNRVFGGKAHNDTVQWIYKTLKGTGYYDVELQKFVELFSGGNATLSLNGVSTPNGLFTYTPRGSVKAPLVAVSNLGCNTTDFPAAVSGKVALISRGSCTFAIKATNAKTAGAAGAIIYDNIDSANPLTGTLGGTGNYVPVVGITKAAGTAALASITNGTTVTADLQVNSILENRTTFNVIAETKQGDKKNVLALGAHTDSVEAGPGINDDGSGTVGILEVAKALTKFKVKNAVRFCFWSAEEYGLLGSEYYISKLNESATEIAKIRAYLNFDMIASPNYIYSIYDGDGSAFNISGPAGSAEIEKHFEKFYDSKGKAHLPTAFDGRSDYGPFLDVGIAAGGIFTGAEVLKTPEQQKLFGGQAGVAYDVNYHKAGDDVNNLNKEAYLLNTQCIADSVATYAVSFDSLGPKPKNVKRDNVTRKLRKERRQSNIDHKIGHGHGMCGHKNPVSL